MFGRVFNILSRRSSLTLIDTTYKHGRCSVQQKVYHVRNIHEDSKTIIPEDDAHLTSSEKELLKFRRANPENEKKYKVVQFEVDVWRHDGLRLPTNLKAQDWMTLLQTDAVNKRKKFLEFLWLKEIKKQNDKIKRKAKTEKRLNEKSLEEEDTGALKYSLKENHMFMRISDCKIKSSLNQKLMRSMMFEPKVVFDCSYTCMTNVETMSCAKQLMFAYSGNRIHDKPFNLYLCGTDKSSKLMQCLKLYIPTLYNPECPLNITTESYLDLFKKEELVYLTPHCQETMVEYDPEKIYIIGALVDKTNVGPLSLAKAKREGIKMEKLPIDKFLAFGGGSGKNLTLNQVLSILLDYRRTNNWSEALEHVPKRKLQAAREEQLHRKLRNTVKQYNQFVQREPSVESMNNEFEKETFCNTLEVMDRSYNK